MPSRRPRPTEVLALLSAALVSTAVGARAQVGSVATEENFRTDPNGTVLATVFPGTLLAVLSERERWVEADLEGWVWARSLRTTQRDGFDLVVSVSGGENLRVEPQGTRLARLREGTLLEELERRPGWIRVRRTGWIWAASVEIREMPVPGGGAGNDSADASPGSPRPDTGATAEMVRAPQAGLAVLTSPDGDTLARATGGADVHLMGRQGRWARVRIEGWAWLPEGQAPGAEPDSAAGPVADAGPDDVAASPEVYRGRTVSWHLQYISLERAEKVRTDFYEGEPFLLTRPSSGEGTFVYVAISPDRLDEVQGIAPLERLVVTGRVRVGASALTGSPIVDLVELRREEGGG